MRRHAQVSRADLLECLHACGKAHLDGIAAALGYERRERKKCHWCR